MCRDRAPRARQRRTPTEIVRPRRGRASTNPATKAKKPTHLEETRGFPRYHSYWLAPGFWRITDAAGLPHPNKASNQLPDALHSAFWAGLHLPGSLFQNLLCYFSAHRFGEYCIAEGATRQARRIGHLLERCSEFTQNQQDTDHHEGQTGSELYVVSGNHPGDGSSRQYSHQ